MFPDEAVPVGSGVRRGDRGALGRGPGLVSQRCAALGSASGARCIALHLGPAVAAHPRRRRGAAAGARTPVGVPLTGDTRWWWAGRVFRERRRRRNRRLWRWRVRRWGRPRRRRVPDGGGGLRRRWRRGRRRRGILHGHPVIPAASPVLVVRVPDRAGHHAEAAADRSEPVRPMAQRTRDRPDGPAQASAQDARDCRAPNASTRSTSRPAAVGASAMRTRAEVLPNRKTRIRSHDRVRRPDPPARSRRHPPPSGSCRRVA